MHHQAAINLKVYKNCQDLKINFLLAYLHATFYIYHQKLINTGFVSHWSSSWLCNVCFILNILPMEIKTFSRVWFWENKNQSVVSDHRLFVTHCTNIHFICDMSHKQQIRTNPLTITDTHSCDGCSYTLKFYAHY